MFGSAILRVTRMEAEGAVWCHIEKQAQTLYTDFCEILLKEYGVATISRLLKIIGLFCKRAL